MKRVSQSTQSGILLFVKGIKGHLAFQNNSDLPFYPCGFNVLAQLMNPYLYKILRGDSALFYSKEKQCCSKAN